MSGFDRGDFGKLSDLHREIREKFVYLSDKEKWDAIEHWEDASTLKNIGKAGVSKFTGDCEEFALVSMDKAKDLGYHARLVVCRDELGEGHCISEVASPDYSEAYYFDNRKVQLATRTDLAKYQFLAVSPWDPVPADERPWLRVKV